MQDEKETKPVKKRHELLHDEWLRPKEGSSDSARSPTGSQSPTTSALALGASFPVVPTEAPPPAAPPLPAAPPIAVATTPGFVAVADADDAFCNAPGVGKSRVPL